MGELLELYADESYILGVSGTKTNIVLKKGCTPSEQLRAWMHALLLCQRICAMENKLVGDWSAVEFALMQTTKEESRRLFDVYERRMWDAGWDLDTAALETRAGTRVHIGGEGVEKGLRW